jgi:hypothetical protein
MKKVFALAAMLAAGSANALTISYSHNTPLSSVPFSDTFNLQLFDTNLGTLTGVTIDLVSNVTGQVDIFNNTGSAQSFTNASAIVPVTVTGPSSTSTTVNATATQASGTAAVGTSSYAGLTGTQSNSVNVLAANFSAYQGVGTTFGSFTTFTTGGSFSGSSVPGVFFSGSAVADGAVTVTYNYETAAPVPEADTYAFMALGMGLVGLLARRRKV